MVSKNPGEKPSTGGDAEPFNLNRQKFLWHKELLASELSPHAKVIGGWFMFHGISSHGKLAATYRRIVNETRIPHRTTRRAVAELVDHDYLWCDRQAANAANLYGLVTTFDREDMREERQIAAEEQAKELQRADRQRADEDAEAWRHAENAWLRGALLELATDGGAPAHQAAEWRDAVMADAQWQIDVAHNRGRRIEVHPAREVLDGLDAAQAAEAATRPSS